MDLSNYLKKQKEKAQSKISNTRQELVSFFVEEINEERKGTKWKPMEARNVAIMLSHLPESELFPFLSECRDYKRRNGSFGKRFFGSLKQR
jgi:hypothetical protein